ncbi:MAG: hypothetical protein ACXVJ7_04190 [Acidimicrobiia bacterium]
MAVVAFGIVALLVALAIASFFVRRHAESTQVGADWTRTDEVFRDPSTARLMRVWLDASGGRHYVPEAALGPEP